MEKRDNAGRKKNFLSALAGFFKKIGIKFAGFGKRFSDGSIFTKISHLIMGFGNFTRKQFTKGILFLGIEFAFVYLMVTSPKVRNTPIGFKAITNLRHLGTDPGAFWPPSPADNSMLMLLFGVLTFGIIGMFLAVYLANIKSSYKTDLDIRKGAKPTTFVQDVAALFDSRFHILMLTPAIIGIVMFTVLPTIFMILIAFTNFDKLHYPPGSVLFTWVGFKNFADIFMSRGEIGSRFGPVLGWTLIWAFFATFTNYIGGILLALLINKKGIKLKKMWRTVFIITIALPQFITLLAVRNLLSVYGPINQALVNWGLISTNNRISFLANATNPWTARFTVIAVNIWIGVPFTMLMTTGILMNVPTELYEAAQIDGATKRKAFWHITVPYILFITMPYLITSFIGNITNFNVIYLLTGGLPTASGYVAGKTDLLVTWLYKLTIEQNDFNLGSVIGIMTFIITATATLLSYRRSKSYKEEDAFQ